MTIAARLSERREARRARRARADAGTMTVIEHLAELRRRIFVSLAAVAIGAVICFTLTPQIISFLTRFYAEALDRNQVTTLIFTGPADAFLLRLKIATYGGVVVAMPVWLFQLWRFVTPGLNPRERRYAVPFILSAIVLFVCGGFVAFLTLKPALSFLLGVGGADLQPLLTGNSYLSLVALMIVAFGVAFEFPVLLVFLLLARVLTTEQLRRWRRWAIVLITLFAGVITPSQDPYSLFFMAVPMWIFYEPHPHPASPCTR
jgi:sec-independent protein translocase protein TatC